MKKKIGALILLMLFFLGTTESMEKKETKGFPEQNWNQINEHLKLQEAYLFKISNLNNANLNNIDINLPTNAKEKKNPSASEDSTISSEEDNIEDILSHYNNFPLIIEFSVRLESNFVDSTPPTLVQLGDHKPCKLYGPGSAFASIQMLYSGTGRYQKSSGQEMIPFVDSTLHHYSLSLPEPYLYQKNFPHQTPGKQIHWKPQWEEKGIIVPLWACGGRKVGDDVQPFVFTMEGLRQETSLVPSSLLYWRGQEITPPKGGWTGQEEVMFQDVLSQDQTCSFQESIEAGKATIRLYFQEERTGESLVVPYHSFLYKNNHLSYKKGNKNGVKVLTPAESLLTGFANNFTSEKAQNIIKDLANLKIRTRSDKTNATPLATSVVDWFDGRYPGAFSNGEDKTAAIQRLTQSLQTYFSKKTEEGLTHTKIQKDFLLNFEELNENIKQNRQPESQVPEIQQVNFIKEIGKVFLKKYASKAAAQSKKGAEKVKAKSKDAKPSEVLYPNNPHGAIGSFKPISRTKAKESLQDGSIWEQDMSQHGGEQWKMWKTKRSWEKGNNLLVFGQMVE